MNNVVQFNNEPDVRFKRDLRVCDALCRGTDRHQVAKREKLSLDEVEQSLIRISGGVSPAIRERHLLLIIQRNEKIQSAHYKKALKGDTEASSACLRANHFTAQLLGLFPPPTSVQALENRPQETTTEQLRAVVDRIRGKTNRTIEGEATEVKDGD